MIRFTIKDLKSSVPDGFIRFHCRVQSISFHPSRKKLYITVKVYDKTLLVDSEKVNIGYIPGAKCACYTNKLSIDLPEEIATERGLHPLGLENLKYL
jgi:hypothetical protein